MKPKMANTDIELAYASLLEIANQLEYNTAAELMADSLEIQ